MGDTGAGLAARAEFGRRVRKRREALGLTQEGLAHRGHLHPVWISEVEGGKRNISFVSILRLAEALSVDAGELMAGLNLAP